ncbi:hypothetical protein CERZMDRAFT_94552 [Cercospora zeae-maydis SCOH1-5]|uniref:Uncharacterized protein n=1 Tax=Cercospora zeae-maydis SCOH1-5 TaxID=717836 RepID=A0A6A6FNU5_9PEZI|nr:hypothetical protein CERZMDRAFT_94552 [Cercospora zeae-maydis SCOH1-5]
MSTTSLTSFDGKDGPENTWLGSLVEHLAVLKERDQAIEIEQYGLIPPSIAERLEQPVPMVVHVLRRPDNRHRCSMEELEKLLDLKESDRHSQRVRAMLPDHNISLLKVMYCRINAL